MKRNIFEGIPPELKGELNCRLAGGGNVRIERVVSRGHASPQGFWYDQERNEFVILLTGKAVLKFEGEDSCLEMNPGDFVDIRAHARHRVEWSDPENESVWLTVFY